MAGILIVEDDKDLRELLKASLTKSGDHLIIDASNGKEALQKFKSLLVDLVITDLVMPEQDGIGLIMELRKIKPGLKIIAISGGGKVGPSNYLSIAETLGANAVFAKPFSIKSLLEKVDEIIKVDYDL